MSTKQPRARANTVLRPRVVPSHEQIAAAAACLWRSRGCPTGVDGPIWLAAERHLACRLNGEKPQRIGGSLSGLGFAGELDSESVMAELDDLFPAPSGKYATSL